MDLVFRSSDSWITFLENSHRLTSLQLVINFFFNEPQEYKQLLETTFHILSTQNRKQFRLLMHFQETENIFGGNSSRIILPDFGQLKGLNLSSLLIVDNLWLQSQTPAKSLNESLRLFNGLFNIQLPMKANDEAIDIVVSSCKCQQVLVIDGNVSATKRSIEYISKAQNLRYFGVWDCKNIGVQALEALLMPWTVPNLKWLRIDVEMEKSSRRGPDVGDGVQMLSVTLKLITCLRTRFEIVRKKTEWVDFELMWVNRTTDSLPYASVLR
ncbi:hypothetical protein HK098_006476 [Nowakowskiella sp. JEL0407]|nr:hypothetical protein HK098_006476 [Nowakowskiella sp. JEL0407]